MSSFEQEMHAAILAGANKLADAIIETPANREQTCLAFANGLLDCFLSSFEQSMREALEQIGTPVRTH